LFFEKVLLDPIPLLAFSDLNDQDKTKKSIIFCANLRFFIY